MYHHTKCYVLYVLQLTLYSNKELNSSTVVLLLPIPKQPDHNLDMRLHWPLLVKGSADSLPINLIANSSAAERWRRLPG